METESALERLLQEAETRRKARLEAEYIAMKKAWRLAPTWEICYALQREEAVPMDQLNQVWAKRYGLKP